MQVRRALPGHCGLCAAALLLSAVLWDGNPIHSPAPNTIAWTLFTDASLRALRARTALSSFRGRGQGSSQ